LVTASDRRYKVAKANAHGGGVSGGIQRKIGALKKVANEKDRDCVRSTSRSG